MIRIKFKPPVGDEKWDKWIEEATAATEALVTGGEPYKFKDALYKKMRQVIFDAFHGKCAYCEAKFILTETGDVEHFRPKGAVTDEFDKPVPRSKRDPNPHPGYYWLAYHWENLLPSCSKCNRPTRTRDGRRVGKGTRFPVLPNTRFRQGRALQRPQEKKERPVFIHPSKENPLAHFVFDPQLGVLAGRTKRGKLCVELLDLNREGLPEERKDIYISTVSNLARAVSAWRERNLAEFLELLRIINAYLEGKKPYSLAGRKALEDRPELLRELERIRRSMR
jgi:hypothetical protein